MQYTRCKMSTGDSIDDIYALMDAQGKLIPTSSTFAFLGALFRVAHGRSATFGHPSSGPGPGTTSNKALSIHATVVHEL
jgi:hypothetical protein